MPNTPHSIRGQALTELVIIGSFMLFLLGALISQALQIDFNQSEVMRAFRGALGLASDPNRRSATVLSIQDRHLPNPSSPFGIGSAVPIAASASIVRNYRMQESPDTADALPRVYPVVQGQRVDCSPSAAGGCTAAGFREEPFVCGYKKIENGVFKGRWANDQEKVGMIDRYEEIYGSTSIRELGPGTSQECRRVQIVDACAGELLDYRGCVRQASRIVDRQACTDACNETKELDSTRDCAAICSQDMHAPWYAQGCAKWGRAWVCPNINQLFAGIRSMGMQPGAVKVTTRGSEDTPSRLTKSEDRSGIQTQTAANWRDTTTRTLLSQQVNASGEGSRQERPVTSTVSDEGKTRTWTTDW